MPWKKTVFRAKKLIDAGADTIAFASCIHKGTPIGFACPFAKKMLEVVSHNIEDGIKILTYTHDAPAQNR